MAPSSISSRGSVGTFPARVRALFPVVEVAFPTISAALFTDLRAAMMFTEKVVVR